MAFFIRLIIGPFHPAQNGLSHPALTAYIYPTSDIDGVIREIFIDNKGKTIGAFSGYSFLHSIGYQSVSTNIVTIVSNVAKNKMTINTEETFYKIRKSKVDINDTNKDIVSVLYTLSDSRLTHEPKVLLECVNYCKEKKMHIEIFEEYKAVFPKAFNVIKRLLSENIS